MSELDTGACNVTILYEDNHIICAVKPRGILSQADDTGAPDMLTILKRYVKMKYRKKGAVYLGLVHRLDRPVGGVMLFARTSKAAGRLSAQLRERIVKKIYFTVLEGMPDQSSGRLEHCIGKERHTNIVHISEARGADVNDKGYAVLDYQTLEKSRDGKMALVRVEPLTGKPHQIRAQFSHIGHPIVGDRKYGGGFYADTGSPALWAASLEFEHPVKQTPLRISAEPPDEYPWSEFNKNNYVIIERK